MGFTRILRRLSSRKSPEPTRPSGAESPNDSAYESLNQILSRDTISEDTWVVDSSKVTSGPFQYLLSNSGKNTRSFLIDAFNQWLQVPNEYLQSIKRIVDILHTASLLVDDIEDNSPLRRGLPAAHLVFGTAQTINSANHAYFLASQELQKHQSLSAHQIFTEEMLNLHMGQGMDLYWRDLSICPTEAEYINMVNNKTSGLFRLAIRLMMLESSCTKDYIPLANTLGVMFQIRDDYKNLQSDEYTAKKGVCDDITEGKFSFPIIHSIHANPDDKVLLNLLKQKTDSPGASDVALSCLRATNSFDYTQRVIRDLGRQAEELVEEVDYGRGKFQGIQAVLGLLQK
ncbi:terpenoid synthase [Aspergillus campestris IBT 28561]|uniref:Terpenoid synthase n=1 Tax=Aspergillus campestris (strain IBT 28561) TaxID=1392248 RepID=A0A2I1CTS2_ASPC2|nr:terpenoid synthase [Aspergillus campestris IBT 28561]PKY01032.1 terpenoid synthase [Aspergillus campestris IBT 28561]